MDQINVAHTLKLERNTLTVTGAEGVDEYDKSVVKIRLTANALTVKGQNLDLSDFSLTEKRLIITGDISDISYMRKAEKLPLIKRLLK